MKDHRQVWDIAGGRRSLTTAVDNTIAEGVISVPPDKSILPE